MTLGDPLTDPLAGRTDPADRVARGELLDDLRGAWRPLVVLAVAGLPLGMLWTLLAPAVRRVVLADGAGATLPGDSEHVFDALAVFVLLVTVFGVIAGAVAWRRRERRGPVALAVTTLGVLLGASVARGVGLLWPLVASASTPVPVALDPARATGGALGGPPLPAALTALSPSPGPWWIVLAAGLGASLTYLFAAIVNGQEDMDRDVPHAG